MRTSHGYETVDPALRGASAAIGNFDGVHRGHRALIEAARAAARAVDARAATSAPRTAGDGDPAADAGATPRGPAIATAVVTFDPHPRRYFQPKAPPFCLTTDEEKSRLLAAAGVDILHVLDFGPRLASMSPEAFAAQVIAGGLGLCHVVVGEDFRFGHRRAGDAATLRRLGQGLGFGVTILHLVGDEAGEYSSTGARIAVEQGRMLEAAAILGRWHAVTGRVRKGDQRGRDLGYPTANLDFGPQIRPRYGVYAAEVEVLEGPHAGRHAGVASIGERPTFGVNAPNFEVHLFDFAGDLYGAAIVVSLVAFLRSELRFDGVEALIAQMDRDSEDARRALARARLPAPRRGS